jgi:protein-tyrosine phosphatase
MKEVKVLMVCLGNICRSPIAEGILAKKCEHLNVKVDSAGTSAYHLGHAPDPRSKNIALIHNISIENQRSRQINRADLDKFDLIYAMDRENLKNILKLADSDIQRKNINLIGNILNSTKNLDIPDPYFGTNEDFKVVYLMLEELCEEIKNQIEKKQYVDG